MIDLRIILLFIFRIILFSALTWGGYWVISLSWVHIFYSLSTIVVVYGILNVWAGFCLFFAGLLAIFYSIKYAVYRPDSKSNASANKMLIFFMIIISSLLTIITHQIIHTKLDKNGYIECHNLQRISTRYISNTYTKTPELCAQLVAEK